MDQKRGQQLYIKVNMFQDCDNETRLQFRETVRSKAFRVKKNGQTQDTVNTSTQHLQVKQCKICLQSGQTQQNRLVTPCKCTGSVKFVHQKCFKSWIDHQLKLKSSKQKKQWIQNGFECELCHSKIRLTIEIDYSCSKQLCCYQIKSSCTSFAIFLMCFFAVTCSLAYLVANIISNSLDFQKEIVTSVISILAISFLVIAEIVILYYWISDFCILKKAVIASFDKKIQQRKLDSNKIFPEEII